MDSKFEIVCVRAWITGSVVCTLPVPCTVHTVHNLVSSARRAVRIFKNYHHRMNNGLCDSEKIMFIADRSLHLHKFNIWLVKSHVVSCSTVYGHLYASTHRYSYRRIQTITNVREKSSKHATAATKYGYDVPEGARNDREDECVCLVCSRMQHNYLGSNELKFAFECTLYVIPSGVCRHRIVCTLHTVYMCVCVCEAHACPIQKIVPCSICWRCYSRAKPIFCHVKFNLEHNMIP